MGICQANFQPYFWARQVVADTAGTGPITVDFEMERGTLLKLRLTDKVSGKPVKAWLTWMPLADNPTVPNIGGRSSRNAPAGRLAGGAVARPSDRPVPAGISLRVGNG
jgi:hypothetical protein